MKTVSVHARPQELDSALPKLAAAVPNLITVFAPRELLSEETLKQIKAACPDAHIMGCSTSGEIGDGVDDGSISLLGMNFASTECKYALVEIPDAAGSHDAGVKLAEELAGDNLKGIFALLPGVDVNGSQFVVGMKQKLAKDISLSGGLAGDGLNFQETVTVFDDKVYKNYAVAVGFYGDNIEIRNGAGGGWSTFGPLRRVTKAEANVLYELDGQSALDLYKEYLGDRAADLPSSGLLYPFAIMDEDNDSASGLIRTILDIDEENGSLILAGDMHNGEKVCLMHANTDQLFTGAEDAASLLSKEGVNDNAALICVSCVGRKILMGEDTEDELDAVMDVMGENMPVAGFYSYGEISHFSTTNEAELHNQTMTITYITEKEA